MGMLANSGMRHLAPFAQQAIGKQLREAVEAHLRQRRDGDQHDHPDPASASGLSDAEQKLYDTIVRRFLYVVLPSAECKW